MAALDPAGFAYVADHVDPRRRPAALGAMSSAGLAAAVLTQIAAQALAPVGWRAISFASSAILLLLFAVALVGLRADTTERANNMKTALISLPRLLIRPRLLALYAATSTLLGTFVIVYTAIEIAGPPAVADNPTALLILRASSLPAVIAAPFLTGATTRFSPRTKALIALVLAAVTVAAAGLAGDHVVLLGLALLLYLAGHRHRGTRCDRRGYRSLHRFTVHRHEYRTADRHRDNDSGLRRGSSDRGCPAHRRRTDHLHNCQQSSEGHSMTHRNAPLSIEGRRRLVERCKSRPIAHVATEMGISRACASKWVNRRRRHGEAGLLDRSATPHRSPSATPTWVIEKIETWRRDYKWSAQRITDELAELGHESNRRTVTRHLTRLGPGRRRFIDPGGENNRKPGKIVARWPGHMAHLDVKKAGRIPEGGGWRTHGRDSVQAKAADRAKSAGAKRGYVYLHSIVDGYSRLAYTEPLPDEKGATAAAFLARAKVWFAAHGITHIHRIVTDNGVCYRSGDFANIVDKQSRHQKTKPYTPRHYGKVERYQRILAEELLYAREFTSEDTRTAAIGVWNIHFNYHRPHRGADGQPPASRLKTGGTNVRPSYN